MGKDFFGKLGKALGKTSLLTSGLVKSHEARKLVKKEQAVQRGMIEQEAAATQTERNRITQERQAMQAKTTAGQRRSNRRRVRGGLFGDASVDTNTSPRLG